MTTLANYSAQPKTQFEPIQQRFTVPYQYDVHFTDNLLDLENPLLANIVSAQAEAEGFQQGPPKVLIAVDDSLLKHSNLLGKIMAYAQAYMSKMTLVATPLSIPGGGGV